MSSDPSIVGMTDLCALDVTELALQIKSGEISPIDVTEAFLARIESVDPEINAFVTVTAERAMDAARSAEREIAGGNWSGPLHGIPIGHKDIYLTAGVRTTAGSRVLADFIPDTDANVVSRLNAAGMIVLGKTGTHEFAYGPTSEISMSGRVLNPWDTGRVAGGSSGGSGAAVAAGLLPIASGSDTGGSIRIPASLCGLTGLKPTYGRISRAGILPLCWSMDHAGPLARSAADAALFLQATAGCDDADDTAAVVPVPDYTAALTGDVRGTRIGVPRHCFFSRAQPGVVDCVNTAILVLEDLGADIIEIDVPEIDHAAAAALAIYLAEATAWHEDAIARTPELYSDSVRGFLEMGEQLLAKDYLRAQRYRTLLGKTLQGIFGCVDVMAMPTTPMTATRLGQSEVAINGTDEAVFAALLRNTEPFNLTGLPAVAAPCGFASNGMPVSLQIVAPAFNEGRALNVVHGYQRATDWHRRRPEL